jgi:hypothetical protein
VLGGWHRLWPHDEFYIPPETHPLLWTVRGSPPWIEVRLGRQDLLVFEHRESSM